MARVIQNEQLKLGEVDVSAIEIDPKSRDDIPKILRGIQYVYMNKDTKEKLFSVLPKLIHNPSSWNKGRPGMTLWNIFVLGTLRVNLNWDYDRLQNMANKHVDIRAMLGHCEYFDEHEYSLQTLKDNLRLFTPELLNEINEIVVKAGHDLIVKKKEKEATIHGRCDSFVVETNVEYPIDTQLLLNALIGAIKLVAKVCERYDKSGWRQYRKHISNLRKHQREVQRVKQSKKKTVEKEKREKEAYQKYLSMANELLLRVKESKIKLEEKEILTFTEKHRFQKNIDHAARQIDQIKQRVFQGKKIPHNEKVFSVYEDYTEWINKGKAGVPFELGLRVSVMEDQYGFILHHHVMEKQTDEKVAVPMVESTIKQYPRLRSCSFDRGYYSAENKRILSEKIDLAMPKKGRLNKQEREEEHTEEFLKRRRQHPAIESAINALECHGLDRCLDKSLDGFKRYVAFAMVGRNMQQLGALLLDKERRRWLMKKAA